jgi:leucyl-tRNA synthetase
MELFGPDFGRYEEVQAELDRIAIADAEREREAEVTQVNESNRVRVPIGKSKAKKNGKIVAKSTGFKYQLQIMESISVPRSEIRRFADPRYWLTYFPPLAIVSLLIYLCQIIHAKLVIGD